ncbi:hypothetical protein M231_00623 [Tremella mesenterica]|uniref:Uncharacterized protein n=1 Tax=Tremella mesenterica TaxID=5217 RepID=A0A4Q1BV51_TREME|nr:hypothetical protein M231_00623 [Tremella mesenterica]
MPPRSAVTPGQVPLHPPPLPKPRLTLKLSQAVPLSPPWPEQSEDDSDVVETRPTQVKQTKSSKKARPLDWSRDGVDGGPTSLDILLRWLEIPGNVDRWRNGFEGQTQKNTMEACAAWLSDNGSPTARDASACNSKIHGLFATWKEANTYRHSTGAGEGGYIIARAEEQGVEEDIVAAVSRVDRNTRYKCPLWDTLNPIFKDRDSGDPSLRSDSTQPYNPALDSLSSSLGVNLRAKNKYPMRNQDSDSDDEDGSMNDFQPPGTPATLAEAASYSSKNTKNDKSNLLKGTPPTSLSRSSSSLSGTQGGKELPSISGKRMRKRSSTTKQEGDEILDAFKEQDDQYHAAKLAKMDEMYRLKAKRMAGDYTKAIFEAAAILMKVDSTRSWGDCLAEARAEAERHQ